MPHYDPAEITRSAVAELPEGERMALLTELLCQSGDLTELAAARNALTDRTNEVIYLRNMLGEDQ
ncbi:MAG: hypothetical protein ACK5LJ_08835 [Paracoccus sp. (in: a-proteobacteria)]